MASGTGARKELLTRCHGFVALAGGVPVGQVETPLFPPDSDHADYLLLRTLNRGRRIAAAALVEEIDPKQRLIRLRGSVEDIHQLPESLPLAGRPVHPRSP